MEQQCKTHGKHLEDAFSSNQSNWFHGYSRDSSSLQLVRHVMEPSWFMEHSVCQAHMDWIMLPHTTIVWLFIY